MIRVFVMYVTARVFIYIQDAVKGIEEISCFHFQDSKKNRAALSALKTFR